MRVNFGPVAADALFVLAGFGVLNAIGILRNSLWDFFAAVGLAFGDALGGAGSEGSAPFGASARIALSRAG